jgi:hypothetical protein
MANSNFDLNGFGDFDDVTSMLALNQNEIDRLLWGDTLPAGIKHSGESKIAEKSIDAVIYDAFRLLIESVNIIWKIESDISCSKPQVDYDKTFYDERNLYILGEMDLLRSQIKRLRDILPSKRPEVNKVSGANSNCLFNKYFILYKSKVSILEKRVNDFLDNDRYKNIKLAIIGAYRSCRESHIIVNSMIEAYNTAIQKEFEIKVEEAKIKNSKYPDPIKKIVSLVVPKEIHQSG